MEVLMANSDSSNDPKNIWNGQHTDERPISVEELRSLARRHEGIRRVRRLVFIGAFVLYMAISIGVRMTTNQPHAEHIGWLGVVMFALLMTWVLGFRYYVADRPTGLGLHAAVPGLEFYRRELVSQLEYFQHKTRWLPGSMLVVSSFFVTIAVDSRLAVPLVILLAIFAGVWYWQWKRDLPRLQDELRSLQRIGNCLAGRRHSGLRRGQNLKNSARKIRKGNVTANSADAIQISVS